MSSHKKSNKYQWCVKITDLDPDASTIILSYQFGVRPQRITISKAQTPSDTRYAYIDGFESQEKRDMFILKWNKEFARLKIRIHCELTEDTTESMTNELIQERDSTSSNQSIYNRLESKTDNYGTQYSKTDRNRSRTNSKRILCRHGDSCFSVDCPYQHSANWRVCKKGAQCINYACSDSHPQNRKAKCKHGSACWTVNCSYLHPNRSTLDASDSHDDDDDQATSRFHRDSSDEKCLHSYSNSRPNDSDSEEISLKPTRALSCKRKHADKSIHTRMAEREKAQLPIFALYSEFCKRLQREKLLLVMSETDTDASTQLPQYAAECFPGGLVVCTQQHSMIAITLAHRVAKEFDGTSEDSSVDYQIDADNSGDIEYAKRKNIIFMTETAIIHQFQADSNLSHINVLIIDDIYRRTLNIDIVMGIAKLLLAKRRNDFFVVLISSNIIDPMPFFNFFDHSSSRPLTITHRAYSVTVENLPPPIDCPDYKFIEQHVIPTLNELYPKYRGHTLVFLSNHRDIEKALQIFNSNLPNECIALPFYGSLSSDEQNKVLDFDGQRSNRRLIIFCTNTIETSYTIKNVQLVIDTGFVRQLSFDMQHHFYILETIRISRSSANRRRNKAGFTKKGHCVRLYNDNELNNENIVPEILHTSLDLIMLQLKRLNLDIETFPFMTQPNSSSIRNSSDLLTKLMCIDRKGRITKHGELCAQLSINPQLSTFMTNVYTEQHDSERLLLLAATIVAILSAPGSLFLASNNLNEMNGNVHNRTMSINIEHNSDIFNLCTIFNDWKNTGMINQANHKCKTCNKRVSQQNELNACRSCRAKYSFMYELNNQVLEWVESSVEFYVHTITDAHWKLTPGTKSTDGSITDADIIGEHLRKSFPNQVGHLLVPHLPDEGARLISSDLRANISNRSIYVQRVHDHKTQYFIAMFITRLASGRLIIDRLHQILSNQLPKSPIEQLIVRENIGWSVNKDVRSIFNVIRKESWAKWLVYEYDQISCNLIIWGHETERSRLELRLESIFTNTHSTKIECGSIRATFQDGLVCLAIEILESALRINLQRVPCKNYEKLQMWLKTTLDINRNDMKENNFQTSKLSSSSCNNDDDDDDDGYEAPPFYILLKSTEAFQRAIARLPSHHLCTEEALSSSTTGTHMSEKYAWGRQLVLTISPDGKFMVAKDILNRLMPHAVDCRHFGKRNIRAQPGIQLINLPRDANEMFLSQILQPIHPIKMSIKQTHRDGTGSSSAHIYFANKQDQQQVITILQSNFCKTPIEITVRNRTNHRLVQKNIIPTLTELEVKDPISNTFLITAINRQSANEIYHDLIPKLESSWQIDGTATVTVTHPHLYPDFDNLIQDIAKQFKIQVQQQPIDQKQSKSSHAIRCYLNHGTPQNTALAAAMLAQATSPIIIKMSNHRQKQLFDELFSHGFIQDWSNKLKLEVIKKEKAGTWIEIRGPQVQQGQLMRQIADYSDAFDERYRILELNSSTANFFGRKKLADIELQSLENTWINWGCHISYLSKIKSIIIYGEPHTKTQLMDSCEEGIRHILNKLSNDGTTIRDIKKCVFCNKSSHSANILRACGHSYCRCASAFLLSTYPLQCNEINCKIKIHMDDLFEIFQEREELMQACKKSIQIYLNNNATLQQQQQFCPNPKCVGLIKQNLGYQMCMKCGHNVCPSCSLIDDEYHQGRTCQERNMVQKMGEYLPELFKAAEKFARDNWTTQTPPIIRIDYNMDLANSCPSLIRFYKGFETLGSSPPPDIARGFFTFHGTAATSIKPICTDGFDPKRRSGQAYGVGEYFGVTAAVSHGYSCRGNSAGPFSMIIAFLLQCPQLSTHGAFCHVMNNPVDWSYSYSLPAIVVSYGNQATCKSPFDN